MKLLFLLLLCTPMGCSSVTSTGGIQEYHLGSYLSITKEEVLSVENTLRMDFDLTNRHLDALVLEGAEICFPATVKQASLRSKRIARLLGGSLIGDAQSDIIVQRKLLSRLERQLDYVKNSRACNYILVKDINDADVITKINKILNSDNQFAVDNISLNPKYVMRLSEAATLLRNHIHLKLKISGHADSTGTDNSNQKLSNERAKEVKRYLSFMGISENRMDIISEGSKKPLFLDKKNKPEDRLINRRVDIIAYLDNLLEKS